MNKKLGWGALALALVVLAGAGGWKAGLLPALGGPAQAAGSGKTTGDKKPEAALEFLPREVVRPTLARLPETLTFSGPLVAPQTAVVRAKAAGTLVALQVAEGARLQQGQLVGRIEIAAADTRLAESSALAEAARATLAQAERSHAGNEQLAAQQFISTSALDNSRAAVDTARAQLQAAQASLETVRVGQRDAAVRAPIAGIVAKRHVLQGEKVSPEQTLLTIVDLSRLELAGSVGTHQVARLREGMTVQVQVEGLKQAVEGRLARIAPAAEPGTRSIAVTVELANAQEQLRAGPFAMARVTLADDAERLVLPAAAVGSTSGQDHVWVIAGDRLARRAVLLGKRDEAQGLVEVLHGLEKDSPVLAARFDNLREGALARVVASTAPSLAAAASATATR